MTANKAVAEAARLAKPQVIPVYPIYSNIFTRINVNARNFICSSRYENTIRIG